MGIQIHPPHLTKEVTVTLHIVTLTVTLIIMKCANCKEEFTAKRKTALYCSPKCRVYASRGLLGQVKGVTVDKEERAEGLFFSRTENGLCKIHGVPLDSRGRCLQKGCKNG